MNWKRTLAILALLLSSLIGARAAVLSGKVVDKETQQPVPHAIVLLLENRQGASSDEAGRFRFEGLSSGQYTISVRHVAYANIERHVTITPEHADTVTIEMQSALLQSDEVIVRSTRTRSDAKNSPYPMDVKTSSEIANQPSTTVADAIGHEPGTALVRDGLWETAVSIRGMSRYDIVVLLDNTRIETANDIAGGLSLINLYDIDRIEVVKGSSLSGTGTFGGVVHCFTKTPSFQDRPTINATAMTLYESVNNLRGNYLAVESESESLRLRASAEYRKADSYDTPDGVVANSQFMDFGLSLFAGVKLFGAHSLDITYQKFEAENTGIPGGKAIAAIAAAKYTLARRELYKIEYAIPNLNDFIPMLTVRASNQDIQRNVQIIASPTMTKTPHADHNTGMAQAECIVIPFTGHYLTAGIEAWQRTLDSKRESYNFAVHSITEEIPLPISSFVSRGMYVQDEWRLVPEQTTMTVGARYDAISIHNDLTKNPAYVIDSMGIKTVPANQAVLWNARTIGIESWNANLGLHQKIAADLDLSLLLSSALRSPSLEERYQFLSLGSVTYIGNPNMIPERSSCANTGLQWHATGYSLDMTVYYNALTNMITDSLISGSSASKTYSKYNLSEARIYGYEISGKAAVSSELVFRSSVGYVRGEDVKHHSNLSQIPPLQGTVSIDFLLQSYGTISLRCESAATQGLVASATAGELATAGHTIVHVTFVSTPVAVGGWSFTVRSGIQNMFNKGYTSHLSTLRGIVKDEPGRNFFLSLTVAV